MLTKKYNLVNNLTGWIVFAIALATYWLTLEPTASYWDCGEFIIQGYKLEVGHPPGNPIFMLTARFFANFAPDVLSIPLMVNAMSGLLSALTILLLFWTITHLVRRLTVKDDQKEEMSLAQYLIVIGSGVVGALAYCWSDTFWFSAVEGEVYAFSSFCTALVFWLILKWENRAEEPHSDRYLILIAYVIGISIAVHLLNLLCIPAIVLVFAYRKYKDMNVKKSLLALAISFVIIALVLFGLVPGFVKMAQKAELLFVNGFHLPFNSGVLFYTLITAASFIWGIYEISRGKSQTMIKVSFLVAVTLSGILFMGSGWWLGWILTAALAAVLFIPSRIRLSLRVMNIALWSISVIFVGYSSYALILIRSSADTPMNQNAPDNVFDLASYLSRDQYGENPLLYGETLYSSQKHKLVRMMTDTVTTREDGSPVLVNYPIYQPVVEKGKPLYAKGVKGASPVSEYGFLSEGDRASNASKALRGGDYYVKKDNKPEVKMTSEQNMFFPRIYSRMHANAYKEWVTLDTTASNLKEIYAIDEATGEKVPEVDLQGEPRINEMTGIVTYPQKLGYRPTYAQNLEYFFNYQLMHMYMRYFMWNFAGRQNDILNQHGELDAGNWISGIPFIDNARLGDQSLLPDDYGKENPGHNVFYMLPLFLGIIGLLWQSFQDKRGVEQFWVIFFLFFMTGIAIVLYLNQPPSQPRERDYAFAGSFYAYAIWIGMGVAGVAALLRKMLGEKLAKKELGVAAASVVIGMVIPIQMVSQTWDDHDRSGRYAARDFAVNYLNSLEPNAIVFCNGDNDTFPLWYAQEVEGVRPDVKIVNLSYLGSDWYANQMRQQSYTAAPIHFTSKPENIAYGKLDVTIPGRERAPMDLLKTLKYVYSGKASSPETQYPMLPSSVFTIPVDKKAVIERGLVAPEDQDKIVDEIVVDLGNASAVRNKGYVSLGEMLMLDIIATNAADGWKRPIYWCSTVGDEYHLGLTDYTRSTGMTHQLVPTLQKGKPARTDRAYDVVMNYKWGGVDKGTPSKHPYFDETARRMLITTRSSMLDVASELLYQGDQKLAAGDKNGARTEWLKGVKVLDTMQKNLSQATARYSVSVALTLPEIYGELGSRLNDPKLTEKARNLLWEGMQRFIQYVKYTHNLNQTLGNVSLTYENHLMPYQYWRFVSLYEKYGGDPKKSDALFKANGLTRKDLKGAYDYAYGAGAGQEVGGDDSEALIGELAEVARVVNSLAGMTPEQYQAASEEDRYYDSLFYEVYQQGISSGIDKSRLDANAEIKKVDMARSKRLTDEYKRKHGQN